MTQLITRKNFSLFFILFLISNFVFSQNNAFVKAKINFVNNDSKELYINIERLYKDKVFVKNELNSKVETINIDELDKITFENETYLIRDVEIDIDRESATLNIDNDKILKPNLSSRKLILKIVLESNISLLYSEINNKDYFFIKNEYDTIEYLIYNELYYNKAFRFDSTYKKQLSKILICNNNSNEFLNANYTEKDLKKLFISYYECKKSEYTTHKNSVIKNKLFLNLISGVKFFNYKFNSNLFARNDLKASTSNISLGIESGIKFKNNNVFLRASFEKVEFSKQYKYDAINLLDNIIFEANFINLNFGYRKFFLSNKKSNFYVDSSIEYTFLFNDKLKSIISDNIVPDRAEENYKSYKSNSAIFLTLGLGYTHNRYTVEVRYSLPKDYYANLSPVTSKISNINLNFIYKLK